MVEHGGPAPTPDRPAGASCVGMVGQGFYNEHSRAQRAAVEIALPLLIRAAETAPLPDPGGAFLVADYGSSEGRNSLAPLRAVVETVRRRAGEGVPIAIVHNDVPGNDFASLFTLLDTSPDSYLRVGSNLFPYASGRSFYHRVFPANQVCLGWSAGSIHWLSAAPSLPDHIWPALATGPAAEALAAQARGDWARFLDHRAHELRPGGLLVLTGLYRDERGETGGERLNDAANAALRAMAEEGRLRRGEYARMLIPLYCRTRKEFTAPFAEGTVASWLELRDYRETSTPDPLWTEYERSRDAAALAADCAAAYRAFTEPALFGALEDDRPPQERRTLADEFYERLRRAVAADPAVAPSHWNVVMMLLAKETDD